MGHGRDHGDAAALARGSQRHHRALLAHADRDGDGEVGAVLPAEGDLDLALGCGPAIAHDGSPAGRPHVEGLAKGPADAVGGGLAEHAESGLVHGQQGPVDGGHEHGVGQRIDGDVGHARDRRWRNDSKHSTEPAIATLSDSERPAIGMVRRSSTRPSSAAGRPCASLPTMVARGPRRSTVS